MTSRRILQSLFIASILSIAFASACTGAATPTPAPATAPLPAAGDFKPQRIAADAEWVAFINVEGLLNSSLVKFAMENGGQAGLDVNVDDLAAMKEQYGIDPMKDIRTITVYGKGNPEQMHFVLLAETSAAVDEAVAKLTGKEGGKEPRKGDDAAPDITQIDLDGQKVNVFSDGENTAYFQVRPGPTSNDRLVIAGTSREWMSVGIKAVEGKIATLDRAEKTAVNPKPPAGSLMYFTASSLDWIDVGDNDGEPASAIVRGAKAMTCAYGESAGDTFIDLRVETANADEAQNVSDIVRGLVAMGRLAAAQNEELKPCLEPLKALKLQSEGAAITVSFKFPTEKLIDLAKTVVASEEQAEKDQAREGAHGKVELGATIGGGKKDQPKKNKDNE